MTARQFIRIWKIFNTVQWCWGLRNMSRMQRWYFRFVVLNMILLVINDFTSFFKFIEQDQVRGILIAFMGAGKSILFLIKIILVNQMTNFKSCLEWCEKWHLMKLSMGLKRKFNNCGDKSENLFVAVVVLASAWTFSVAVVDIIVMSIMQGTVVPFAPTVMIWAHTDDWINQSINSVIQLVVSFDLILAEFMFFGIVFVTVEHVVAVIESIQTLFENSMNSLLFKKAILNVLHWHCDLIYQQKRLASITSIPILAFEIFSYAIGFLVWTVVLFDNGQYFIAVVGVGMVVPFIMLCWMNERILDTYQNLKISLYDMDWIRLNLRQKKMLLLVIIMVDRPTLLRAGPFHFNCSMI